MSYDSWESDEEYDDDDEMVLRPPFPWTGSKTRFVDKILDFIPQKWVDSKHTYFEPFIGSGVVFLSLKPQNAVISDININIVNTWKCIHRHVDAVASELRKLPKCTNKKFVSIRNMLNKNKDVKNIDPKRAAYFIYFMHCAFGSLYLTRDDGNIISTFRKPNEGKLYNYDRVIENIYNISDYMKSAKIRILLSSYEKTISSAKHGDFIYFDPPYMFTKVNTYRVTYGGFNDVFDNDQFFNIMHTLHKKGILVLMSNSYHITLKKELSPPYTLKRISTIRGLGTYIPNSSHKKSTQTEILMYNYMV